MTDRADGLNRTVWLTTAVLGITYAISGMHHGFFEVLQGSQPTPGIMIASIGPEQVRWEYGTDGAMTLIPNFLVTGIAAIAVSLAIVVWCLFFLARRRGPTGFLGLFILLTLVGGGIGHTVFFLATWAYATRMRSGLGWWRRVLGPGLRRVLASMWLPALATSSILFLVALEVSVFGFLPGVNDAEQMLTAIWVILLASLVTLNVAFAGAVARDLPEPVPARV